jgi:hypothetical protein
MRQSPVRAYLSIDGEKSMAMKIVKKTADYTIYQRGDERYAVQDSSQAAINGDDKVRILVEEGLIKAAVPAEPVEEVAEEEPAAEEPAAEEAAAEEPAAEEPAAEEAASEETVAEESPAEEAPAEEAAAEEAPADEETKEEDK